MSIREHEEEPVHGLPADLPTGERILWQGGPDTAHLAVSAFHVRGVAIYFALIALWRFGSVALDGGGFVEALIAAAWIGIPAALALGVLWAMAVAYARTTVYTLTNERVVIRAGLALTMTINVPFGLIDGAALRSAGDGTGDLVFEVNGKERISWLLLWPNVRAWRLKQPQPMLRSIPEASLVASLLTRELKRNARMEDHSEAPEAETLPAMAPA